MGEIADAMLDGDLCEGCGEYMEGGSGFTRRCAGCEPPRSSRASFKCAPTIDEVFAKDLFSKPRRWLERASATGGVSLAEAPAYLTKLERRGHVKLVKATAMCFITALGRVELVRIAPVDQEPR